MKHHASIWYLAIGLAVLCNPLLVPVQAEDFTVSSLSSAGAYTSPLINGQAYVFTASGVWNTNAVMRADPEWSWNSNSSEPWYELCPWTSPHGTYVNDYMDLVINDVAVNWLGSADGVNWAPHVFSPNHVYKYYYTGTGASVHLYMADRTPFGDAKYYDNSGDLQLNVSPVPEPGTMSLLALVGTALLRRRRGFAG